MTAPADVYDALPAEPSGTAVLLLAGSSGRIERTRADLLAAHGARVRALRWFGGVGQRPAPHEVPLELFLAEIDRVRGDSDRVALFGTSFGAEAVLTVASVAEVDATIAVAPSSVVWAGEIGGDWSSHWTLDGIPLPFVPFEPNWRPSTDPPEYRSLYLQSLRRDPAVTDAARIPVERIGGEVLLVVGGDDLVWPSDVFGEQIVQARQAAGLVTTVVSHPDAGHRMLLPGETAMPGGIRMARGGDATADAALGALAWPEIVRMLHLR